MITRVLLFCLAAIAASAIAQTLAPAHCVLRQSGDAFNGSCGALFDETPVFELKPAPAITSGIWRADIHPASVWAGTMTLDSHKFPAELEAYGDGRGILRTEEGWFAVTHITTQRCV